MLWDGNRAHGPGERFADGHVELLDDAGLAEVRDRQVLTATAGPEETPGVAVEPRAGNTQEDYAAET